jgi:sortase A
VGSSLIILGFLIFLFVGYQLWGTGIEAAQSQNRLENKFSQTAQTTVPTSEPVPSPDPVVIDNGDPMALLEIPTLGVTKYVVAGVETDDLKKGPGHYPYTPFPGELGNAAIAGHRTTYGEPFRPLDDLNPGDPIIVTDLLGRRFVYLVTEQLIVQPEDSWVVNTVDPTVAKLTLTTCHPEFSARQRLIVFATLDPTQSDPVDTPAAI